MSNDELLSSFQRSLLPPSSWCKQNQESDYENFNFPNALLIIHTNKCTFYNIMNSKIHIKIHIKILKMPLHVLINSLIVLIYKFSKEQCMLPEVDLRIQACRSVSNVLT
jgi:hypothetical protein